MTTSRQSKGFIQLEWVCPNCNSRNPGPQKTCERCGAPQPENVQFYAPAEAKLIQDENIAKIAKAGADIHCGFCGTRNPATATVCSQCGGDLKEGRARQAGGEAQREAPIVEIKCTNCGEANPSTQRMCAKCGSPLPRAAGEPPAQDNAEGGAAAIPSAAKRRFPAWAIIGSVVAFLVVVGSCAYLLFVPAKTVTATVSDVYWQTSIPLQELQAVTYTDEEGSPPAGAYNVSCHTETEQACVEKTIDTGTGYAEVVQECHDVSTQHCSYTVDEWKTIQTYTLEGHDLSPIYASPSVLSGQRLGNESVTYTVTFASGGETYTYAPADLAEFQQFTVGSIWTLHLNALGNVVSIE